MTVLPALVSSFAAAKPANPAPMMIASASAIRTISPHFCAHGGGSEAVWQEL
jgi:hypothetical protein